MPYNQPIISPSARRDLNEIWSYIAKDSIEYADRVIDDLEEGINLLSQMPGIGRPRTEFDRSETLSFWAVRNYLVVYRSIQTQIEIIRVLHSSRNIPAILNEN